MRKFLRDNFIEKFAPGLEYGVAPWPAVVPGQTNFTMADCDMLTIPRGAKHPREAWEFIKYVQTREGMELLCAGQWKHSPLSHVSERFYREHKNKRIKLFYDLAAGGHIIYT